MTNSYLEKFEKMKVAGKLASQTLDMITNYIKPGISTEKIDKLCYEYIRDNGGHSAPLYYRGYPKSCCTSANHIVCHGIPSPNESPSSTNDPVSINIEDVPSKAYNSYVATA